MFTTTTSEIPGHPERPEGARGTGIPDCPSFHGSKRYQITKRLGEGGFGEVFKAIDRLRGGHVALKVLKRLDPDALYRFKKEFRSLTDLHHPNLVRFYDLVSDNGQWFLTMELVEGVNFIAHVRGTNTAREEETTMDLGPVKGGERPRDARRMSMRLKEYFLRPALRQLAHAVCALHAAGRLHRDIKPSNVLVSNTGIVKLLDFGLVTEVDNQMSLEELFVGTAAYMAPEQALAKEVTPAADWYSVGVMLYQALTGCLPHKGDRFQILMEKQIKDPLPPKLLEPEVDQDLSDLCMQLLNRAPVQRPTGKAVLQVLGSGEDCRTTRTDDVAADLRGNKPFVDRYGDLETLVQAFESSRSGRAVIVHLSGPSGAGETTLMQQLMRELSARDCVLLKGRCHERESVPYKALDGLMDDLSRTLRSLDHAEVEALLPEEIGALSRLFPVLGRVEAVAAAAQTCDEEQSDDELHRRGARALRDLMSAMARRWPLVLLIDDVQRGDKASMDLLSSFLQSQEPLPLMLVLSFRGKEKDKSRASRALLEETQKPGALWQLVQLDLASR